MFETIMYEARDEVGHLHPNRPQIQSPQRVMAGLSLMGAFDLVVSGQSAKYTMAYTRVGVTPDGEAESATAESATTLAHEATAVTGHAKRVIYNGMDHSLESAGEFEAEKTTEAMASHDGLEGIAAFVEKRAPEFD